MKKTRFTESQIVAAIQKQELGIAVKDICRDLGIDALQPQCQSVLRSRVLK